MNLESNYYLVINNEENVIDGMDIHISTGEEPDPEEYFPKYGTQYGWTVMCLEDSYDRRGEPMFLFFAALFGIPLVSGYPLIPTCFLSCAIGDTSTATASRGEYYRFWQVIGRVVLAIAIIIFLWMGLLNIV